MPRISVHLTDEAVSRLDEEAKKLGTSRGAMITTWIGEKLKALDVQDNIFSVLTAPETLQVIVKSMMEAQSRPGADQVSIEHFQQSLFDDGKTKGE